MDKALITCARGVMFGLGWRQVGWQVVGVMMRGGGVVLQVHVGGIGEDGGGFEGERWV